VQKQQKNQTFWDRVKLAMVAKKMKPTQTNAARLAQRAQPTISEIWSKPTGAPEHEVVLRLARELEVCVEWLYTGNEPMKPGGAPDQYASELLTVWGDLDDRTKRLLVGYAVARASGLGDDSPFAKSRPATPRPQKATS